MGLSNELSCEAGSFSCRLNPNKFFQSEVLSPYFPALEPWVVWSVSLPVCYSLFICTQRWDRPVHQPPPCSKSSLSSCPSPPLLPVWMGVSSLTPWLSDFHTVQISVSSGCCCFLKFVVVLLLVVRGGTKCLPMPPSWLEVSLGPFLIGLFAFWCYIV